MSNIKLFDTHCHLDMLQGEGGAEGAVQRAVESGVAYMQTICVTLEGFERVRQIAAAYPNIVASIGVHPNHVLGASDIASVEQLLEFARDPKVTSLGETGLDYYHLQTDRAYQKQSFANHIHAAQASGLPLVVHTRDAAQDTLDMLECHMKEREFGAIIHCFTQDRHFAYKAIDMGFWISFSGIVTFKNAQEVQFCAANIPMESMLIETDAPYLAPGPMRGKPNEPAYLVHTAQFLAHLRGVDVQTLALVTTQNAFDALPKGGSML